MRGEGKLRGGEGREKVEKERETREKRVDCIGERKTWERTV